MTPLLKIHTIDFVGAGNVATALGKELVAKGLTIDRVFSRTPQKSDSLAKILNATAADDITDIGRNSDMVILAIPDKEIEDISKKLEGTEAVVVHSSGNQSINDVSHHKKYGVFYPLQTFSAKSNPDFMIIPVCVESNSKETTTMLMELGSIISNKVIELDSESRRKLHLSAVTVNNFTNILFDVAFSYLEDNGIDHKLLFPLIDESVKKIQDMSPRESQTGPAVRKDFPTIETHLDLLKDYKHYKEIYSLLSEKIIQIHHDKL